jgi:hypothetical protein
LPVLVVGGRLGDLRARAASCGRQSTKRQHPTPNSWNCPSSKRTSNTSSPLRRPDLNRVPLSSAAATSNSRVWEVDNDNNRLDGASLPWTTKRKTADFKRQCLEYLDGVPRPDPRLWRRCLAP